MQKSWVTQDRIEVVQANVSSGGAIYSDRKFIPQDCYKRIQRNKNKDFM